MPNSTLLVSRSVPRGSASICWAMRSVSSTAARMPSARSNTSRPISVADSERVLRSSSLTPNCVSSSDTTRDKWLFCERSASAARVKLPVCTTFT